jgi:hypothetical protein
MLVYVRERMMSDTYGPTFVRELAYFDHDLSCWRTLEDTLLSDSVKFSEKLPSWGTVQGGVLSEHRMPELHISEHECSLLPTARATGAMNDPMDLTLRMVQDRGYKSRLEEAIALLPTPTVVDMGNNKTPDEWEAWKETQKAKHRNGNGHGASLTQEAISLLPTPKATNNENQQNLDRYGPNLGMALMPDKYDWTSASTKVQSVDGNASSDEQHLSLS